MRDRVGTDNRGTGNVHDAGEAAAAPGRVTLFVLPNPIQVISLGYENLSRRQCC